MGMFGKGQPKAANVFARASEYKPTVRDKTARALLNVFGDGRFQRDIVEDVLGSSGLGHSKQGLVDWTPVGAAFASDEGGRKAARGNVFGGAADVALAALPIPAAAKGMFGAGKRVKSLPKPPTIDRSQAARMARAEELGFTVPAYHGTPDARNIRATGRFSTAKERYDGKPDPSTDFWATTDYRTAKSYADPARAFDYQGSEPAVLDVLMRQKNPAVIDAGGKRWTETLDQVIAAQSAGHDGIVVKNVIDDYNGTGGPATTLAVFGSDNIRLADDLFADPPPRTSAKRLPDGSSRKRR